MASTLMPQFINPPTRPFPSEKPYFGGRSGQPGRSSLGGSRKCALLYRCPTCISVRPPGDLPAASNAASRYEPFRFVQGLRPLRRNAAIPGVRWGPDVSRIWETSERRRCNGSAPRHARKMRTAAQITKTYAVDKETRRQKGEHHHTQGNHRTNYHRRGAAGPGAAPAAADGKPTEVPR